MQDAGNITDAVSDLARLISSKQIRVGDEAVLYVSTLKNGSWVLAPCQPLKGEQIKLDEFAVNAGGVRGSNSARVTVIEGRCKGSAGWIGTAFLATSAN